MALLKFGQPLGAIIQVAYIVENIEHSMQDFSSRLKVGPWFVSGPFTAAEASYRGQPTNLNVTLAVGFAGHMSFELIEQNNDVPSVYREIVQMRGYGFHHWAIATDAFDAEVEKYLSQGYQAAFTARSSRGYRVAYMDTTRDLPGMVELIELTEALESRYADMYRAATDWDGSDPVRRAA